VRNGHYYLLIFYGHGVHGAEGGQLLFEDDYGAGALVRAGDMGAALRNTEIRLVVLGACQSATVAAYPVEGETLSPDQGAVEAQKAARQQRIQEEYGTTAADRTLWQAAQQNISYMGRPDIYALIVDAEILQWTDDRVLIGVATEAKLRQLSHPVTQAAIKRGLSQAAGRSLTPQFVLLAQSCDP
jgi:hypothetical protein